MILENQVEWVHRPDMSSGPRTKKPTMSRNPLEELATLVEGFDEDHHDYREVRAAKRLIHDLIKAAEATK